MPSCNAKGITAEHTTRCALHAIHNRFAACEAQLQGAAQASGRRDVYSRRLRTGSAAGRCQARAGRWRAGAHARAAHMALPALLIATLLPPTATTGVAAVSLTLFVTTPPPSPDRADSTPLGFTTPRPRIAADALGAAATLAEQPPALLPGSVTQQVVVEVNTQIDGRRSAPIAVRVDWGGPPLATTPIVSSWHDTAAGSAGSVEPGQLDGPSHRHFWCLSLPSTHERLWGEVGLPSCRL